jgi:hypothetical protein
MLVYTILQLRVLKERRTHEKTKRFRFQKAKFNISISIEKLTSYTGDYEMNPASFLKILIVNDRLKAQVPGSLAMELSPLSENKFFLKVFGVDITFVANKSGKIKNYL